MTIKESVYSSNTSRNKNSIHTVRKITITELDLTINIEKETGSFREI